MSELHIDTFRNAMAEHTLVSHTSEGTVISIPTSGTAKEKRKDYMAMFPSKRFIIPIMRDSFVHGYRYVRCSVINQGKTYHFWAECDVYRWRPLGNLYVSYTQTATSAVESTWFSLRVPEAYRIPIDSASVTINCLHKGITDGSIIAS